MHYQIKLFSQLDAELKKNWINLEKDSNYACFNSLSWVENYILSYKDITKKSNLRIFIIFYKEEPVCIFPFEIVKKFKTNILQWACDSKADFNAPIRKNNFNFEEKTFKDLWKKILNMLPEVDLVYLKKQIDFLETQNNPLINFLKNFKEGTIRQIQLPSKWEEYKTKIIKKKFYSDLIRTKKLIKKYGKVQFIIAKSSEEKKILLESLIKQKKEELLKNKNYYINENDLKFYKNFENYKKKEYMTQISAIKLDENLIAMHWGVTHKNYYYYLLPSMKSEGVKQFSPGKLLLSLLIRWSISKKIKIFDFGLGEEHYKKKWSNKTQTIYNYVKLKKIKAVPFYIMLRFRQIIKNLKR